MTAPRLVAAVLAAGLVGLAGWRLRTGRRARAALGASAAALLALYASGAPLAVPDGEAAIEDSADALDGWTYPFVAAMAFLETSIPPVTVIFPGEFAVLLGGAIAGEGRIEIVPLVALVWVCSALGDSFTFVLGRRLGRPFLLERGPAFGLTGRRVERLDRWFERYGPPAICLGRLLPLARPFGPFLAGASRFPYRRFLAWNVLGTLLFALLFCLLGYVFYRSYGQAADAVGRAALAVLALLAGGALAVHLVRKRRRGGILRPQEPALEERVP
jgi:membrane protein DedA with SNARE-associated domain